MSAKVHPGDVVAAVKTLHGPKAILVDYEVLKGTENVQGFMSTIFRVRATSVIGDDEKKSTFIVKTLPPMKNEPTESDTKLFVQEIAFFNRCLPLMRRKCPDLKIVDCLFAHSANTIVLEDLTEQGFDNFTQNLEELKDIQLSLQQVEMVLVELAKFHASSQGTNWLKIMPEIFEKDILLEVEGAHPFFQLFRDGLLNCVVPILEHIHKDTPDFAKKYTDWLSQVDENVMPLFFEFLKPSPIYLNAVCHGDCWMNNILIRSDPDTNETVDLRLIDMQLIRFAPIFSDIQYFIVLYTTSTFRKEHLDALLKTYVQTFNAVANLSPDLLNMEDFMLEFNETRLQGILMSVCMSHLTYVNDFTPSEGEEMTEEGLSSMFNRGKASEAKKLSAIKVFKEDQRFKNRMQDLITELIGEMDRRLFM